MLQKSYIFFVDYSMTTKSHAFLILAHNNPAHIARLVKSLVSLNHFFFIHIDKKSNEDFSSLEKIPNCMLIKKRVSCNWGGFSLVKATLNLIQSAKEAKTDFAYYHLISGSDYFCSTNEAFDQFFENNTKSYLDIREGSSFEWRLKLFTFNDFINRRGRWKNILWHTDDIQKKLLPYITIRKPLKEKFYYGSQWFSLSNEVIDYILDFCKKNRWFVRRFYLTFVPDESFFHMIIMNGPKADQIVPKNLRFIDWNRKVPKEPLPRTLDVEDYDDIVKSGCFFCRKISTVKSATLLEKFDKLRGE